MDDLCWNNNAVEEFIKKSNKIYSSYFETENYIPIKKDGLMNEILNEEISKIAYYRWLDTGCPDGTAEEDWKWAEEVYYGIGHFEKRMIKQSIIYSDPEMTKPVNTGIKSPPETVSPGYFYCPYLPLMTNPILDPKNGQQIEIPVPEIPETLYIKIDASNVPKTISIPPFICGTPLYVDRSNVPNNCETIHSGMPAEVNYTVKPVSPQDFIKVKFNEE